MRRFLKMVPAMLAGLWMLSLPASAEIDADWTLFGSNATQAGSSEQLLSADRYERLTSTTYGLTKKDGQRWVTLVSLLKYLKPVDRLRLVQRFFNNVPYSTDSERFATNDHWASVGEFMEKGGDCEDFALTRMRALVDAGFPPSNLRIVIVDDRIARMRHAVLAARIDGRTYILDNQRPNVVEDKDIGSYRPLFAIDATRVWSYTTMTASRAMPDVNTLTAGK